ncbi:hypothetical protein M0R45_003371 [Rubus argutus]|uniref:Galactinol--sucrose galactosyltransferase n=1 Tax=Rubus argutus TaxID=59490 RepID=A0AAW1YG79_RUBAR
MAPPDEPVDPIRNLFHSTSSEQYFYLSDGKLSVKAGLSPRFLIIDDGWQSINFDGDENPNEDANLVIGGTQMTCRLHRFEECDKFRNYKGRYFLDPKAPLDSKRPKMLISKALGLEDVEKACDFRILSELLYHILNSMFQSDPTRMKSMWSISTRLKILKSDPFQITIKPSSFEIFTLCQFKMSAPLTRSSRRLD